MNEGESDSKIEQVQQYYGEELKTNADLKTNACKIGGKIPKQHSEILKKIHPKILEKFYGCGSPIPLEIEGCTILDLGCGCGRDVYLCSFLAGPKGKVIGVDMTPNMIDVGKEYREYHAKAFGFEQSNVEFLLGTIEDLKSIGIEDNSIDVVISNCVVNLSANKEAVFQEIYRVLKQGGELYFSDVFADRRIPKTLREDKIIWGECLSGALYTEDFRRILLKTGIPTYSVLSESNISISNKQIEKVVGPINFKSLLIRAFKLEDQEDKCEDFGQIATYLGTIKDHPHAFKLDPSHVFVTDDPQRVCMNTAAQLGKTRFSAHFKITAPGSHLGLFGSNNSNSSGCASSSCC